MPETTVRGIRYPLGVDSPDWPGDFNKLAADIDELVPRVAIGKARVNPTANTYTRKRVAFPAGMFDAAPNMVASGETGVPGRIVKGVSVGTTADIDKNGGDVIVYRTNTTAMNVTWAAWQNGGGVSHHGWQVPQYDGSQNTLARPTRFLSSLQAAVVAGLVRIDAGTTVIDNSGAAQNGDREKSVSFTSGRFTAPPTVITCMRTTVPGGTYTGCGHSDVTASGMKLHTNRSNSPATEVNWIAVQPTAAANLWTPGGSADLAGIFQQFAESAEGQVPRIDSGYSNITPIPGSPSPFRVEFEPGQFTKPPFVVVTAGSAAIGSTLLGVGVFNETATGCDVYVNRTNNTLTGVRYFAVQP